MAEQKSPEAPKSRKADPKRSGRICENMNYAGREALKRLRTNVMIALPEGKNKKSCVIGVTSSQPSEGKSTVTINLAYSIAELGKSVLLIDGDMRRPVVHSSVGIALSPGLSEILNGTDTPKNAVFRYRSKVDNTCFDLIPGGEIPTHPAELLNSSQFQMLIDAASDAYDYVLVDLPPVNAVVDAVNVSSCTDGLIVVIRENHCPRYVLQDCMDQLRYAKANILGFVLNGCTEGFGKRYKYSNKYQYKYE